jgi:hypothetical protein
MFSRKWWGKTLERMAKTAAQTLIALIGADRMLLELPWDVMWQVTATTTLLSFLTCIVTTHMGPDSEDPGIL